MLTFDCQLPTGRPASYTVFRTSDGAVYSPSAEGFSQSPVQDGEVPLPESGQPGTFLGCQPDVPPATAPGQYLIHVKSDGQVVRRIPVSPDPNAPGAWAASL